MSYEVIGSFSIKQELKEWILLHHMTFLSCEVVNAFQSPLVFYIECREIYFRNNIDEVQNMLGKSQREHRAALSFSLTAFEITE